MIVKDIRVFVPSKDYQNSKRFYQRLGFEMVMESEQISIFQMGEASFYLQNFYNQEFAENLMMQLTVADIEAVHQLLTSVKAENADMSIKFSPPKAEAWGKVIYLWGPAGELWHITQYTT